LHHVKTVIVIDQRGLIMRRQCTLSIERNVLLFLLRDERVVYDVCELVIERLADAPDHPLMLGITSPLRPEHPVATEAGEQQNP
jgi:hypothetical protein